MRVRLRMTGRVRRSITISKSVVSTEQTAWARRPEPKRYAPGPPSGYSGSRSRNHGGELKVGRPTKRRMPAPLSPTSGTTVRVLDEDLELAAAVDHGSFKQARLAAVAPLIEVPKGPGESPSAPRERARDFGLLVLSGLLVRDMELAGRSFVELRGPEDLLRPWDDAAEVTSVSPEISWTASEPTRLA